MRVLFVTGLTAFATGGVQTETVRLVGGCRDRGTAVAYCGDRLPAGLDGVPFFRLDYPPADAAGQQVKAAVDAFHPDVVHVVGGGLQLLRHVDDLDVPWVFTCHNVPPFERVTPYLLGRASIHYAARNVAVLPIVLGWKRFLRRARFGKVIAHSRAVADHVAAYGCPADRVVTIPFGCDAADPAPADAEPPFPVHAYPKVLTVAGYAFHKGPHDYVDAAAKLVEAFPHLSYRIVGNSRNRAYTKFLQDRIDRLDLGTHVALLRNAGEDVRRAALATCDLYVQPSHEEGYCLAFAEAAMVAPRLIGCRTGEIPGIADGEATARVVEPRDVPGLAAATRELMAVPVTPADVAARGQRLLARYSWAAYLDRHLAVFTDPGSPR